MYFVLPVCIPLDHEIKCDKVRVKFGAEAKEAVIDYISIGR
jgi:hypothetical protein